ncbi:MAG: ATP-dependent Clp protease adaptor ClpS [Desulfobacterales bacterium]
MSENLPDLKEDVVTKIEEEVTEPPMYKVLLHNDNFTTKEFVVKILVSVFSKSLDEATQLMWAVHKKGVGVCGVYPFEIAETKVNIVTATARENGFPLRSTMEPD